MKPIWLFGRPDTTPNPSYFTCAVTPVYCNSNFAEIESTLKTDLLPYVNVAAIDEDDQSKRLGLVLKCAEIGFQMVELDEQLNRGTLTVGEFEKLQLIDPLLIIGITTDPLKITDFVKAGARPDFVCAETYYQHQLQELRQLKNVLPKLIGYDPLIDLYAVINFADPATDSANPKLLPAMSREAYRNADGVWFWGWQTGNAVFEKVAQQNYPAIATLIETEFKEPAGGLLSFLRRLLCRK